MTAKRRLALAITLASILVTGCHEDPVGPGTGGLEITVVTTGVDLDPNGYSVAVDGGAGAPVPANGTVTLAELAEGNHELTLSGLDDNCVLQEAVPLHVVVAEDHLATASLHITCTHANTLAYVQDNAVYITAATPGSTPRLIAQGYTTVSWSPDGSTLALVPFAPPRGLFLTDADGGNPRQLTATYADGERLARPVWSPDGQVLLFEYRAASPVVGLHPYLRRVNRDGSGEGFFIPENGGGRESESAAWSPDGAHVAIHDVGQICLYTPAGVLERCLTRGFYPSWSPDGGTLAFSVGPLENPFDQLHIHTISIDGSGERDLSPPLAPETSEFFLDWSPDGTKLLFTFFQADHLVGDSIVVNRDRAMIMDRDGGNRLDLAPGLDVGSAAWSRDGTRVALVVGQTAPYGGLHLYVVNSDGTGLLNLETTGVITSIAWRP